MAYILIAVGALMAAAGLYVVGYGSIEARYDEYWPVLSAGATLIAGGMVTIAMGVAIRALMQVKAALLTQATAGTSATLVAGEPSLSLVPAAGTESPLAPAEPGSARIEPADPQLSLGLAAPTLAGPRPHPLRPLPKFSTHPELAGQAAVAVAALSPHIDEPSETAVSAAEPAEAHETAHDDVGPALQHFETVDHHIDTPADIDISAARPADDYKLEMPSTPDHDLPHSAPTRDDEPAETPPHSAPATPTAPVSEDWLDRALADLDEELPLTVAPPRAVSTPIPETTKPTDAAEPRLEPAMVASEATAAADHETQAPPALQETAPADAPIIGRYEADGTSYVMYADGSIEAQSSAGVYRFNSMAELKAFIET